MKIKLFFLLSLCSGILFSQNYSVNDKVIQLDSSAAYSFIVSGHLHGDGISNTGLPAVTLMANLDSINNSNFKFFVSLGDLFKDIESDLPIYRKLFFPRLNLPLYNVVGNHDLSGNIYQNEFGKTFYSFVYKSEQYIFLDAELDNSSIKEEQLTFFKSVLDSVASNKAIKNVFIFTHRPIWAEEDEQLKNVFKYNTRSKSGNNYQSEILPLLTKLNVSKNVFWMSGSMDAAPVSFFYHKIQYTNITLIQTAIRNQKRDAALIISINNGEVNLKPFSFTNETTQNIEDYNLNYYNTLGAISAPDSFNVRLIPLYFKQVFFSRYFWYGIMLGSFLVAFLSFYRKKSK